MERVTDQKFKGVGIIVTPPSFILFDVEIEDLWLGRYSVVDIAAKFDVPAVPIVFMGRLDGAIKMTKEGFDSAVAVRPRPAEGMVGTPVCNVLDRRGNRVIVKLKTKDFL